MAVTSRFPAAGYRMAPMIGRCTPNTEPDPGHAFSQARSDWRGTWSDRLSGDIVMPGDFKLNIKDAEKLKGLLPKRALAKPVPAQRRAVRPSDCRRV